MDKIKEYLEYRLKELDFVLGYFEDEDIKGDINAKITLKEIDQVKNLLVLLSVGVRSEQLNNYCDNKEKFKCSCINHCGNIAENIGV